MDRSRIRNFSIIAHIDHGKSTLADRLLELTGTIPARQMAEQVLDTMDLERERGITIKAAAVRMEWAPRPRPSPEEEGRGKEEGEAARETPLLPSSSSLLPGGEAGGGGATYELNLIDTPGHVDFTYEVSRALAACEGALLVVDASQGIEAQTLANVYMALDLDLTIIPVVNKIDLPSAEPERVAQEMVDVIGFKRDEVLFVSAKEGTGVEALLAAIVQRVPPPSGDPEAPLRALIFDSKYDSYKGVIAYVRVVDGEVRAGRRLRLMQTARTVEPLETGVFRPSFAPTDGLAAGEVGYIATGLKTVRDCRVGDTVTDEARPAPAPLPGYKPAKSMVFAGLYPANSEDYELLRDALEKLHLNDASLNYEPESSVALGPGFRAGFLGLLHMDIVQERLEREYGLDLLATAPSVEYHITLTDGSEVAIASPADMPEPTRIAGIGEPWMNVSIVAPDRHIGNIMELVTGRRGEYTKMDYLEHDPHLKAGERRVLLEYKMPLSEMLVDFYDQLKGRTQGYASMDYSFSHYSPEDLVKVDILVNGVPVDALSMLVHGERAQQQGRALVERLRSLIPRQLFEIPIQAAIGGRIIARESVRALRKNVLAKCYGGDVTRKRKLLEKQKAGKKRMKRVGNVEIPQEAFMSLLRIGK
ncbi:MAG: translation elongation factor 4 [Dehalococcoidia bacterium]|nr:translation elongation factor 4 [Dehalococcoidia bacterium]